MAKKKKIPLEGKFGKIETHLTSMIINDEFATAKSNQDYEITEFERIIDKIENIRAEKNYEWQSDINLGLMVSHLLTEQADWAAQEFQSRDFCDILLEGDKPDDALKAKAAKIVINKLLNVKDIFHYQKRIRSKTIAWMNGYVDCLCYWEKERLEREFDVPRVDQMGQGMVNEYGEPIVDKKKFKRILKDRFNYQPLDPRNVFTSTGYTYSNQEKDYIFIRSEKTIDELKKEKAKFGYINLELLESRLTNEETETSKESYGKTTPNKAIPDKTPIHKFDVLDRYGKIWAIVKEVDDDGNPTVIEPGYDDSGNVLDDAELVEAIISYANPAKNAETLIRFQPTWAIDAVGRPYKPIIRGVAYIHPTKDQGMSDGKNLAELDTAANDTFNIGNDRTMLSTMVVMKGKKQSLEDNPTIFFAPGNVMHLENPDDIQEFRITDNIQGAMQQLGFVKNTASELDAKWPTTMGAVPEDSSTTATAVNGAEGRTNRRGNLKSLTWTYSFDAEFYQMMLQMVYMNAEPETLEMLVGEELASKFDPNADYVYVPISANVEAEHSKMRKVSTYDQMMGRITGLAQFKPQPVFEIVAQIIAEQSQLLGGDFKKMTPLLENLVKAPVQQTEQGVNQTADASPEAMSNQNGTPMTGMEQDTRGMLQ
jgi:hypothetical protein